MDYNLLAYFALATASLAIGFALNRKMINDELSKFDGKTDKDSLQNVENAKKLHEEIHATKLMYRNLEEHFVDLSKLVSDLSLSSSCMDARVSQIENIKIKHPLKKIVPPKKGGKK